MTRPGGRRPPGWVPPEVDTRRANIARVYDYWLGGDHNFLADQDVARAITAVEPNAAAFARANREFLGRAVRFLAAAGIRQFLDIGSGISANGNVHQIAQSADPQARVVYVDVDPVAVAHSQALLAGHDNAEVVAADLREPEVILADAHTRRLIDPAQPTGLLLVAVLHFLADAEILRFFDGFDLLDPGVTYTPQWRPDAPGEAQSDPGAFWGELVGAGRKG